MVVTKEQARERFMRRFRYAVDRLPEPEARGRGRFRWLGKELGVTYQAIQKWWNGESLPTAARMLGLSLRLGVTVGYLRGEGPESPGSRYEALQDLWAQMDEPLQEDALEYMRFKIRRRPRPEA